MRNVQVTPHEHNVEMKDGAGNEWLTRWRWPATEGVQSLVATKILGQEYGPAGKVAACAGVRPGISFSNEIARDGPVPNFQEWRFLLSRWTHELGAIYLVMMFTETVDSFPGDSCRHSNPLITRLLVSLLTRYGGTGLYFVHNRLWSWLTVL